MQRIFLLMTLLITGCSSYNKTFYCEPGRGVGCRSLSQVNQMVDRGELPTVEVLEVEETPTPPRIPSSQGLRIWIAPSSEEGALC